MACSWAAARAAATLLLLGQAYTLEAPSSSLPHGHPQAGKSYPERPGFSLWLVEEFDAPIDLNADPIWTWSDGGLGEGQVRFVKEAIKFKDGKMIIETSERPENVTLQACSHAEVGLIPPKRLLSGEMRTKYNMFRYGYYEVSMKAPSVQPGNVTINGNYISTMFVFRDSKLKHWREIDIEVTGDSPDSVTLDVLYAEDTPAWLPTIQATQEYEATGANVRADFHTYAFEWLPTGITWYFDGKEMGHHGPEDKLPVPELSGKIMMNLWVFNWLYGFGGREGLNNEYPFHNEYDWFRFYRWDGDAAYPCADAGPGCLTQDDLYFTGNNPCDGVAQVGDDGAPAPCTASCEKPEVPELPEIWVLP